MTICLFCLFGVEIQPVLATEEITIYLQWYHQFQFAGYYAAQAQGFYQDSGLAVTIVEGGPGTETFKRVLASPGNYGTAHAAGLLSHRAAGEQLIVLASLFQHSPNVIIARADRGIRSPHDLVAERTVIWPGGHVELSAMLKREGLDPTPFRKQVVGNHLQDMLNGRVDAIDGYISNEVITLREAEIPIVVISPINYGVDFYGDVLITSKMELDEFPDRAKAFRAASLRGWEYAMANPEETVSLILNKYQTQHSRQHLLAEAQVTKELLISPLIEIGHMNPGRWQRMVDALVELDMMEPGTQATEFLFDPNPIPDLSRIYLALKATAAIAVAVALLLILLLHFNRRLRREINVRQSAQESLNKSEARYDELVETAQDLIWRCDTEGRFTYLNPAWERTHGYELDEMLGRPFTDFELPQIAEKDLEVFQSHLDGGQSSGLETTHQSKSGEIIHLIFNAVPTKDDQGNTIGTHGTAVDVTDRKKMEEELLKVAKLESIGVLAGGIAHDLNNYLTGIVGNIGLAKMFADPAEKDKRLEIAEADVMRVKELTQRLLTFSKGGAPVRKLSDLGQVVRDAVNFTLSGSNLGCDYDLPDEAYPAEIDSGQIRQVINNLVINAQQAMPEGGKIKVSAEKIELSKGSNIPLAAGPYVQISVEDWGVGIPEDCRSRIFDPFFTTKPNGSGLGLATAYSIIQKHSGCISVESEEGVGTKFEVYLPASPQELSEREDKEEPDSRTGEGRILVMDDQEHIRDLVEISLSKLGYDVVTCADGAEAIEKYQDARDSGNPFQAVILDLTIPGGMGGSATIKRLKAIDPGVTAIVASGYADDPAITNYRDHGFKGVITKPYKIEGLKTVLHEVLKES